MSEGGDNSGGAAHPAVVGVSRRFGVGHMLVATGLFALLFSVLQVTGASLGGYLWCSAFCAAIALGQVFLYQGRLPRRASCLVGSRFALVMVSVYGTHILLSGIADKSSQGTLQYDFLVVSASFLLWWVFLATIAGYVFGYLIGVVSAGIFLVVDRKRYQNTCRVQPSDITIPPTGRWWLDWMAWSPVMFFWRNRQRPLLNAVLLTFTLAVPFVLLALTIPLFWGAEYQQCCRIGASIAAPVIGAALAGLLLAGWRMPLVLCALAMAGVAFPLHELTTMLAWRYWGTGWSWGELTICVGLLVALLAAGSYGWLRWFLASDKTSRNRRRLNIGFATCLVVLCCLSSVAAWFAANTPRERALQGLNATESIMYMESFFRVDRIWVSRQGWVTGTPEWIGKIVELRQLCLDDVDLGEGDLTPLENLDALESITLSGCSIRAHALDCLSFHVSLNDLTFCFGTKLADDDLEVLRSLRNLNTLTLCGTGVSDSCLEYLEPLRNLELLQLSEPGISGSGFAHLEGLRSLQRLCLQNSGLDDEGLSQLPRPPLAYSP